MNEWSLVHRECLSETFSKIKFCLIRNFDINERMRNYSWKNNLVVDYNIGRKIPLNQFFGDDAGEILAEIGEDFLGYQAKEKVKRLFLKYQRDLKENDLQLIIKNAEI